MMKIGYMLNIIIYRGIMSLKSKRHLLDVSLWGERGFMRFLNYHIEAYKLVFRKGFMNFVKLFLFSVILVISLAMPVLTPIALIASVSFFKAFLEKGEADLFETLKGVDMTADRYLRLLIAALLQFAIMLAGYFLFVIPGIIFTFALAPLFYIITLNPDITTSEAFKSSFDMMNGNKLNLFLLRVIGGVMPMIMSLLISGIARFAPIIGGILGLAFMIILPLIFAEMMIVDMMFYKDISKPKAVGIEVNTMEKVTPKKTKLPKSVESPHSELTLGDSKEVEPPKE